MTQFSAFDAAMMAKALRLAEQGQFLARPNPRVGCVITQQNTIVGEGYHQCFGQPHAEVNALLQAGAAAQGATTYVTLEPCAHVGKTPPCAQALIDAGVQRVVCAMRDPNPRVDGGGFQLLQQAGIEVRYGLMASSAAELNRGFIKRMSHGLPWVRVKLAQSLDGRTAIASGESQWITARAARADVQQLRARHDAIISGSGTHLADDPSYTVRFSDWLTPPPARVQQQFRQPLRVVLDRRQQLNLTSKFFSIAEPIWWVTQAQPKTGLPPHVKWQGWDASQGLLGLLRELAAAECNEVLVEAGSALAGAFMQQGLVDELIVYQAPKLLGHLAQPLLDWPLTTMAEAHDLRLLDARAVGRDWRFTFCAHDD